MAVVKGELCKRGRGSSTEAVALQTVAAITCDAREVTMGVGAASAGPDPARPVLGRSWEGAVGETLKVEAASFEDGMASVGLNGWPDREGTVID